MAELSDLIEAAKQRIVSKRPYSVRTLNRLAQGLDQAEIAALFEQRGEGIGSGQVNPPAAASADPVARAPSAPAAPGGGGASFQMADEEDRIGRQDGLALAAILRARRTPGDVSEATRRRLQVGFGSDYNEAGEFTPRDMTPESARALTEQQLSALLEGYRARTRPKIKATSPIYDL